MAEPTDPLAEVVTRARLAMTGACFPWAVAGGWAMDLFLNSVTRSHADPELAVFGADQARLQSHLSGWDLRKVVDGRFEPWAAWEWLSLPVHEVHARSADKLEFLLNERDGDRWVFRRDPRVTLPLANAIVHVADGVPVLAPEVVLLFKAKLPRVKDDQDFAASLAELDGSRRHWLRAALQLCHPGHP